MRITQGTFSFLPDFSDEEIEAQLRYSVDHGWAIMLEYTDDPHPRNALWDMWSQPHFDVSPDDIEVIMRDVRACREKYSNLYVKVVAYDASLGRQTSALSFIVNRPPDEPGFQLRRQEAHDRVIRYTLHPYATDEPHGRRYQSDGGSTTDENRMTTDDNRTNGEAGE